MADELVDIYNENYELIGKKMKSEAQKAGDWVTSIHCWIVRSCDKGYVLFQKRGANKKIFPNILDISAAGHYKSGEKISDGVRELSEELGISVNFESLIPLGIKFDIAKVKENIVREFCHTYLLLNNKKPNEYILGIDEVEGLVEISIEDGLALFADEVISVNAHGIEYDETKKSWKEIEIKVEKTSFIPRIDKYYYKIFIMADRLLKGEKYLAI